MRVGGCGKAEVGSGGGKGKGTCGGGSAVRWWVRGRWGRLVDGHLSGPPRDGNGIGRDRPRGWRHGRPQPNWDRMPFARRGLLLGGVVLVWPYVQRRFSWLGAGAGQAPHRRTGAGCRCCHGHGLNGNFGAGAWHTTEYWALFSSP